MSRAPVFQSWGVPCRPLTKPTGRKDMKKVPEVRIPNDLVSNKEFLKFIRSDEYGLFLYLQAHIIRGQQKKEFINLYQNYYKEGLLATQWNQEALAEKFDVDERTIKRWIKSLVDRKFIKINKEIKGNTKVGNKKIYIKWNVYTLGEVKLENDKTIESLYYITEFNRKKRENLLQEINNHFDLGDTDVPHLGDTDVPCKNNKDLKNNKEKYM